MNVNAPIASSQDAQPDSYVVNGDIRWHLRIKGSGPQCLLIHGTGASVHSWDNLTSHLERYFTLVMVDLPGHADTLTPEHVDLSLPAIATALHSLLESRAIKPEVIIGHSAGSAIMLELCLQQAAYTPQLISINGAVMPLRGLAGYLFAPLARMSANTQWMPRLFAYRAKNPRNIKKLLDSTGSSIDQQSFDRYRQLFSSETHVAGVLRLMASWQLDGLLARLDTITHPVLLIAASNDTTVPLRDSYRLQQHLPNAELSVINGRGHLVHEEDAESVAALIIDRLATLLPALPSSLDSAGQRKGQRKG